MGALQKVLAQVMSRLRDVTLSQRVALLLGGALVAVALIWMVQWAASPELVPLLDQELSSDEMSQVTAGLDALGKTYELRGSRIYVPAAENRVGILARLQQEQRLPANTSAGFAALIQESNPWISQTENNRRWTYALQEELRQVLRQFNGVHDANVFLNLGSTGRRGFSKHAPKNSASVTLVMKGGSEVTRPLAIAAARMVAGAVAGLNVRDVEVLDASGGTTLDWNAEQDPSNTLTRLQAKHERRYTELIRRQVPDPGARISVQVTLDTTTRNTQTREALKGTPRVEETTSDKLSRQRDSGQPGVQPNVGMAASSGGMGETQEKETSKTEYDVGMATKTEAKPAGEVQLVTAAINLSSSYLEAILRHTNPDLETPTDDQLEETFQRERSRLLPQVARLVTPQQEDNVALAWHYDTPLLGAPAGEASTLDQSMDILQQYGPQGGLGLLALISLGVMLRMARKTEAGEAFGLELGLPKEAIDAARRAADDVAVAAADETREAPGRTGGVVATASAGQAYAGASGPVMVGDMADVESAAATEGMLEAREVDPGAVQVRKMLDQVVEITEESPDAVASLVDQWIAKSNQYHEGGK